MSAPALLLAALSLACSRAPSDFVVSPGTGLLERLVVTELPAPRALPAVATLAVPDPSWSRVMDVPDWQRVLPHVPVDASLWRTSTELGMGEGTLAVAGHALREIPLDNGDRLWRSGELHFWWRAAQGQLYGVGAEAPADVSLRDVPVAALPALQYEGRGGQVVPATCERVTRPALVLPSPAHASVSIRLEADQLRVALAVPRDGAALEDGELVVHPHHAVRFRLTLEPGGVLLDRLVEPGQAWLVEELDVSASRGQPVTLTLTSEGGIGLWADLTLLGSGELPAEAPDILLIDIDTLRADRLGLYGCARPTSPRLDAWAREHALAFRDAKATASWTLPSTVSLLTGLAVHEHGVRGADRALGSSVPTLAAALRGHGYLTVGLVEGGYVSHVHGLHHGFDTFDERAFQQPDWEAVRAALDEERDPRPAFVFLQTYAVHAPLRFDARFLGAGERSALHGQEVTSQSVFVPFRHGQLAVGEAEREYVLALYDAAIRRLDEELGEFLASLADAPNLVILITSDHGEEFLDHGGLEHGHTLYDELLRVPLLLSAPGVEPGWSDAPVSLLDVAPTLLQLAGLPSGTGRGLLGRSEQLRAAEILGMRSVQLGRWKLIRDERAARREELYDLEADPAETRDLLDAQAHEAGRLRALLDELRSTRAEDAVPAAGSSEALRALGYLGDGR